ncbi:MAG: TetR family transcriptional regulator [Gammaproteobacteria bacterium HGW-Gammaproteobacteria-14]|nr:MAG: TetR family transcriptional regulator [Gammaproteobacteria bacterium HGW-Gammaproteobacteria-14]
MAQAGTVDRILDTAEVLFAQKGFAETSLRAITSKAGVNLAAVNYHFGSKESLIQAVFERFLKPFCAHLDNMMSELEAHPAEISLERLLATLSKSALAVQRGEPQRVAIFFRLSGLAYSQAQGHLRRFFREHYGDVFRRFLRLLAVAVPDVPPMEVFWRVHFALGATIFTLSGMDPLRAICRSDFGVEVSPQQVDERLLAFVAGGIRATVSAS